MDLPFYKLRVARSAWIVLDRMGENDPLEYGPVARGLCHKARGASARGLVVLERGSDRPVSRCWNARGEPCVPEPSAKLCAARFLFDSGRTDSGKRVRFLALDGETSVEILDSRSLGISLGFPEYPGGARFDEASAAGSFTVVRSGGTAMSAISLGFRGSLFGVFLHETGRPSLPPRPDGLHPPSIIVRCVSRSELRVRAPGVDALRAAGSATVAAQAAGYSDREASARFGPDDAVFVSWNEDGSVFAAAEPSYCLTGEYWIA